MNKMREIRRKEKVTLAGLAEKTDLSIGYLAHLELGSRKNPSKETMEKIALALNSSVQVIFFPKEDKKEEANE